MGICKHSTQQYSEKTPTTQVSILQSHSNFKPACSANLSVLFQKYKKTVQYLKISKIFVSDSQKLRENIQLVTRQKEESQHQEVKCMIAIKQIIKLYPERTKQQQSSFKWILAACLKHHKFVTSFPMEIVYYEDCLVQYRNFLEHAYHHLNEPLVPSKLADFMWHVHLQDPEAYKRDMLNMFGFVLVHEDQEVQKSNMAKKKVLDKANLHNALGDTSNLFNNAMPRASYQKAENKPPLSEQHRKQNPEYYEDKENKKIMRFHQSQP